MGDLAVFPLSGTTLLGQNDLTNPFLSDVASLDNNSSLLGVLNTIRSAVGRSTYTTNLGSGSTLDTQTENIPNNEKSDSNFQFNRTSNNGGYTALTSLESRRLPAQPVALGLTVDSSNVGEDNTDSLTGTAASAALVGESSQDIKINFQPNTSNVPTGYIKDIGEAYSDVRGFGWVRQDSLRIAN